MATQEPSVTESHGIQWQNYLDYDYPNAWPNIAAFMAAIGARADDEAKLNTYIMALCDSSVDAAQGAFVRNPDNPAEVLGIQIIPICYDAVTHGVALADDALRIRLAFPFNAAVLRKAVAMLHANDLCGTLMSQVGKKNVAIWDREDAEEERRRRDGRSY